MEQVIVFDNAHYRVVTGFMTGSEPPVPVYLVVNKQYDMVEIETTILIRAISLAKDYSDFLDMLEEDEEEIDKEDILEFTVPDDMEVVFESDFDPNEKPS